MSRSVEAERRAKKGEYVRIIANTSYDKHFFKIGDIALVIGEESDDDSDRIDARVGEDDYLLEDDDYVVLENRK